MTAPTAHPLSVPADEAANAAYRAGLCRDCHVRPYSAGRPRCEQCHQALQEFTPPIEEYQPWPTI